MGDVSIALTMGEFWSLKELTISIPSPVTTEGGIKNECMVVEMRVNIARASEIGLRSFKFRDIWKSTAYAGWNRSPLKKPHLDSG